LVGNPGDLDKVVLILELLPDMVVVVPEHLYLLVHLFLLLVLVCFLASVFKI
jgi:hypothetical protein